LEALLFVFVDLLPGQLAFVDRLQFFVFVFSYGSFEKTCNIAAPKSAEPMGGTNVVFSRQNVGNEG